MDLSSHTNLVSSLWSVPLVNKTLQMQTLHPPTVCYGKDVTMMVEWFANVVFWLSQSRQEAQEHEALVFWLNDEGINHSCPSIMYQRGFASGIVAPVIAVSIDFLSAGVAMNSGLFATEENVKAERDSLLEELNCFKTENEQLNMLILEKVAVMKAMPTCPLDMKKNLLQSKPKRASGKSYCRSISICKMEKGDGYPHGRRLD